MADKYEDDISGSPVVLPTVTPWTAFTPTGTWTTNTTYSGYKCQVGGTGKYMVRITLTGAPNAVNLRINMPVGETIGSQVADYRSPLGRIRIHRVGIAVIEGDVVFDSTGQVAAVYWSTTNTPYVTGSTTQGISPTAPVTFASGDVAELTWECPVVEFATTAYQAYGAGQATDVKPGLTSRETSGSFLAGLSGSTAAFNITVDYAVVGKLVTLQVPAISWTSTSGTTLDMALANLPAALRPKTGSLITYLTRTAVNTGGTTVVQVGLAIASPTQVKFYAGAGGNSYPATLVQGVDSMTLTYLVA